MCFEERFILNKKNRGNIIYNEHLIRYCLAKRLVYNKVVLDIACGTGFGTKILALAQAEKVVAIDIDEEAIKKAKKENFCENIVYKRGNAEKLEEKDNFFDIIVSFETIEHLKNHDKYLSQLKRVAKDEGLVLISTPNKEVFGQKNPFHFKEFGQDEFREILGKYFKFVLLLEQGNGIASFIKAGSKTEKGKLTGADFGQPLYFIAICSQKELRAEEILNENLVSINQKALKNLYNNPGLKIANCLYRGIRGLFR